MAGLGHRQDRGVMLPPLDEIDGFMDAPGFYNSGRCSADGDGE